ncbi:MAG: hypothetical protein IPK97_14175 [Ahniella sp.]|nr:hypothetical protein [Ahniella sp.]
MNKLQLPAYDDSAAFVDLSKNAKVGSYPHLQPFVAKVKASYAQYIAVNGEPTLVQNLAISQVAVRFLEGHYESPPNDLAHIATMRDRSEHLVCPMCGSMHSGTLDHYLPRKDFPIFVVFSKNLVPACKCNVRRNRTLLGPNPGERVLHPYFDACLSERLVSARFEDLGTIPKVSLGLMISNAHPHYSAIDFHVRSIVQKSAVVKYLADRWSAMFRKPSLVVRAFEKNMRTQSEVKSLLERERDFLDDLHKGKNNWNSIFVSGLLDPIVLSWLAEKLSMHGRVQDSPLG